MADKVPVSINLNNTPVINVTEKAKEKLLDHLYTKIDPTRDKGDRIPALRIGVRPGGCAGFSYEMYSDFEINEEEDEIIEFGELRVIVDSQSKEMIKGSTLDYKEGLMGAGFSIDNPNAQRTCGCENSFG